LVRAGSVPTVFSAQQRLNGPGTMSLPAETEYFLHVHTAEAAELSLIAMPFGPGSIAPTMAGNRGTTTFTIDGIGLNRATGFELVGPGGERRPAANVRLNASGELVGAVDLAGAAIGAWTVAVSDGVHAVDLP